MLEAVEGQSAACTELETQRPHFTRTTVVIQSVQDAA
jgi:hypothetical protein